VIDEAKHAERVSASSFGAPKITLDKLRGYKEKVVGQFTKGLAGMAKQRKVRTVQGTGKFISPNEIEVDGEGGKTLIRFEQCIIAAGSQAVKLPNFPWDDPRVMDSTDALELAEIPKSLLVVGGGIIGLEMATVYRGLGSEVTVVEFMDQLMPGADKDLVKPLADRLKKQGVAVHLKTKAARVEAGRKASRCISKAPPKARSRNSKPAPGIACSSPSGAHRTARRSMPTRPASTSASVVSSPSTARCAATCRTSSPSAIWSASRCSRTRPRTRANSRPKSRQARSASGSRG
jgi:hypothetical protein